MSQDNTKDIKTNAVGSLHGRGLDVTLESDTMVAPQANQRLRDIGKLIQPHPEQLYIGSFAMHIYVTRDLLGVDRNIQTILQQIGGPERTSLPENISDGVMQIAMGNLNVELKKIFTGQKHKSSNPLDRR